MSEYIKGTWKDAITDESGTVIQEGTVIRKQDMDRIEGGIEAAHQEIMDLNNQVYTDIDCGGFVEDTPIATHNREAMAHTTMIVDGNDGTVTTPADLNTHASDPHAHQNLIVNGNAN